MPAVISSEMLSRWQELLTAWDALALTLVLAVVMPVHGYFRHRRLQALAGTIPACTKLRFYASIVGVQWLLVAGLLFVLGRHHLAMADIGERLGDPRVTLGATSALLVALTAVAAIVRRAVRRARPERLTATVDRLRAFVPGSSAEKVAFVGVCVTAGVCEELLYRGWLLSVVYAATRSIWIAGATAAALFGLGHAYQGLIGVLRTSFIGIQFVVLYVLVGSLVPGQILHAGVDLIAITALSAAVARLEVNQRGQAVTP